MRVKHEKRKNAEKLKKKAKIFGHIRKK